MLIIYCHSCIVILSSTQQNRNNRYIFEHNMPNNIMCPVYIQRMQVSLIPRQCSVATMQLQRLVQCYRVLDINCISLPKLLYVEVYVYDGLLFNILVEICTVVLHFGLDTCQIKLELYRSITKVHRCHSIILYSIIIG